MNKELYKKADMVLDYLSQFGVGRTFRTEFIFNHFQKHRLKLSESDLRTIISLFLTDELITPYQHPHAPQHNFGFYSLNEKGDAFYRLQGGYRVQTKIEQLNRDNIRFTWYRHWIWFVCFVISFLFNLFFLLFYIL